MPSPWGGPQHLIRRVRWVLGLGFRPEDFRRFYGAVDRDAWGYGESPRSSKRFEVILDALPLGVIPRALEVGCAEGHLTKLLAPRMGELVACDFVDEATRRARVSCEDLPNVRFLTLDARKYLPDGHFELLVFSDVLYYFSKREISALVERSAAVVPSGGSFVFANVWQDHYRGLTSPEYVLRTLRLSRQWQEESLRWHRFESGLTLTCSRFARV